MPSVKLAVLLFALLLIVPVMGAGGDRQLILNIYVEDTDAKKALVVGHIDDPESLPFLNASEHLYEENGQFYAVSESLLVQEGDGWRLKFPVNGYYDEYNAVFYIPGGFELTEINCSQGLEFLSSTYNGSLVLEVQGFDLTNPEVTLSYKAA